MKTATFWTLTIRYMPPAGISSCAWETVHYFSTERKLELWKQKNPEEAKKAEWGMNEISLDCAKELIKLSKKKVKQRCQECGR